MERGAGIIVIKKTSKGPHVLGLKIYGKYDLPKGEIEGDESPFDAACRECAEESGLTDLKFPWGLESTTLQKAKKKNKKGKSVTLFIATTEQEPEITPNPKTGEYEHHGTRWLSLDEAEIMLHEYLRPCIEWVRKQLATEQTQESVLREFVRTVV